MRTTNLNREVVPDLPGLILLSHGPLSRGLLQSFELVFGDAENLVAIELEEGDDPDAFIKAAVDAYERMPDGSVFLLDVFGGTPFNKVMEFFLGSNKPIRAVCGMNLGMLMEGVVSRDESSDDLPERLAAYGTSSVIDVGTKWAARTQGHFE